jgi:hypothetical protein
MGGLEWCKQAHALDNGDRGAAHVDRIATAANSIGALDHGHIKAISIEPVSEGRPGDTRAGDQNGLAGRLGGVPGGYANPS